MIVCCGVKPGKPHPPGAGPAGAGASFGYCCGCDQPGALYCCIGTTGTVTAGGAASGAALCGFITAPLPGVRPEWGAGLGPAGSWAERSSRSCFLAAAWACAGVGLARVVALAIVFGAAGLTDFIDMLNVGVLSAAAGVGGAGVGAAGGVEAPPGAGAGLLAFSSDLGSRGDSLSRRRGSLSRLRLRLRLRLRRRRSGLRRRAGLRLRRRSLLRLLRLGLFSLAVLCCLWYPLSASRVRVLVLPLDPLLSSRPLLDPLSGVSLRESVPLWPWELSP